MTGWSFQEQNSRDRSGTCPRRNVSRLSRWIAVGSLPSWHCQTAIRICLLVLEGRGRCVPSSCDRSMEASQVIPIRLAQARWKREHRNLIACKRVRVFCHRRKERWNGTSYHRNLTAWRFREQNSQGRIGITLPSGCWQTKYETDQSHCQLSCLSWMASWIGISGADDKDLLQCDRKRRRRTCFC